MAVDTKAILIGNVTAEAISIVLKNVFPSIEGIQVNTHEGDSHYYILFDEPNKEALSAKDATMRKMYVFPPDLESGYVSKPDVYAGEQTLVDLSSWGSHKEIVEALAKEFGGFVSISDSDDWTLFEPSTSVLNSVSPEDRLKIELASILPLKEATILASLVNSPNLIEQVVQSYADYVEAKNDAEFQPKP